MSAYRVDGIMEWQAGYVAASVIVAMAFTAVAFEGTAHNLNSQSWSWMRWSSPRTLRMALSRGMKLKPGVSVVVTGSRR